MSAVGSRGGRREDSKHMLGPCTPKQDHVSIKPFNNLIFALWLCIKVAVFQVPRLLSASPLPSALLNAGIAFPVAITEKTQFHCEKIFC